MKPYERSTLQLASVISKHEGKHKINSYRYNCKTHSTLREKIYIGVYAVDLHFLITRAGWLVTHIYEHYMFAQSKFKKRFCSNESKIKTSSYIFHRKGLLQISK